MRRVAGLRAKSVQWLYALLIAIGCVAVGYLARLAIDALIQGQVPFVTFYPAVMAASLIAGVRAGILAVVLSTPIAAVAFGNHPIATSVIWIVLATVVAVGCGLAYELRARLRDERDQLQLTKQKLELVIGEQAHRAKNTFAILNALAEQSAQGAHNIEEFRDRLIARIQALSSAYSLMSTGQGDEPIELAALINLALGPFQAAYGARLSISPGPPTSVAPSAAIPLALCLHELATNAVKYGALSNPSGAVVVAWAERAPGAYSLQWAEAGGPEVTSPRRTGFGARLINAALNGVPGGGAILKFRPEGVLCDLNFSNA